MADPARKGLHQGEAVEDPGGEEEEVHLREEAEGAMVREAVESRRTGVHEAADVGVISDPS